MTYTREEWAVLTPEQRGPCTEWTGYTNIDGYGQRNIKGKVEGVHRIEWKKHNGPIPNETPYVLHHCDNPPCYEITHLFLGDQYSNMRDMIAKGRQPAHTGSNNPNTWLTEDKVLAIRAEYTGVRGIGVALARKYGLPASTISHIVTRRTWTHI